MRRIFAVPSLALALAATAQVAGAQINVQTEDGNQVTIGPGGISIQKSSGGPRKTVNITPSSGISVRKSTGKAVDISAGSGINVRSTGSARARTTSRTTVTTKSQAKTTVTAEIPLEQQVTSIEIQVYGRKSDGPLVSRIEKLEIDNIGKTGTGSLKQRVAVLNRSVGLTEPSPATGGSSSRVSVTAKPAVSVTGNGSSISIKGAPGAEMQVTAGGPYPNISGITGSAIVISNSGHTGTIKCNGDHAVINASNCKLRFQGNLGTLTINGSLNDLTCDNVQLVTSNGSNNSVSWSNSSATVVDHGSNNRMSVR